MEDLDLNVMQSHLDYRMNECESLLAQDNIFDLKTRDQLSRQYMVLLEYQAFLQSEAFDENDSKVVENVKQLFESTRKVIDKLKEMANDPPYASYQIMPSPYPLKFH